MAKVEILVVVNGFTPHCPLGPFEVELPDAVVKAVFEFGTVCGLVIVPPKVVRGVEPFRALHGGCYCAPTMLVDER